MENVEEQKPELKVPSLPVLSEKWALRLILIVLIGVGIITALNYQAQPKPKKYEYKVVFFRDDSSAGTNNEMTNYGLDGWQVVNSRRATADSTGLRYGYEVILMKEVR